MSNESLLIKALIVFVLICTWDYPNANAETKQEWPKYVSDSMWVPPSAKDVKHALSAAGGSYQIFYTSDACYPAKSVLEGTAHAMTSLGWVRSEYDLLNPWLKRPSAYPLVGGRLWQGYPWVEYWKDHSGNVVIYSYSYDVNDELPAASFMMAVQSSCKFQGAIVYYPSDVFERFKRASKEAADRAKGIGKE